jgi:diaminopimelate epimerase
MKFTKMQGLGNDYVYIDCFEQEISNKSEIAKKVSDRHFGIGGDGAIFINPSDIADCEMEMYNADGSRSEMCGNGIRCVGKYVFDNGIVNDTEISVVSMGKIKYMTLFLRDAGHEEQSNNGKVVDTVRVDMGEPEIIAEKVPVISKNETAIDEPIEVAGRAFQMTCVSMGNPHAVIFVNDVDHFDVSHIGPEFENHAAFPNRINTEFVEIIDRNTIKMRVWERGAGETLACGTGSCASVVACILNGLTESKVTVKLLGGELQIEWDRSQNRVYMTGTATTVFKGEIECLK